MRRLAVLMGLGALALSAGVAAASRIGAVREYPLNPSAVHLFGIGNGPDGAVWFADQGCMSPGVRCLIVRLSFALRLATFSKGLLPKADPYSIVAGPDGNLWFTDEGGRPAIGRITPSGHITEFTRGLEKGSLPFDIAVGPDGNLWFTVQGRRPAIARITLGGRITEFSRGLKKGSLPFGIAAGAHGRVWFTDHSCEVSGRCAVGDISTHGGRIHEQVAGLRAGALPLGMSSGPGGTVWFADGSGAIGRISSSGRITEFTAGLLPGSQPVAIAPGPDGALWFTDEGATAAIGRITTAGRVSEFTRGLVSGSQPAQISPAADGELWFTDQALGAYIGAARTGVPLAVRTPPRLSGPARPGAVLGCVPGRWARWSTGAPSARRYRFDGYRWRLGDKPIPGARARRYTVTAADAGHRLSCQETVTYGAPLLVSATAASHPVLVSGG